MVAVSVLLIVHQYVAHASHLGYSSWYMVHGVDASGFSLEDTDLGLGLYSEFRLLLVVVVPRVTWIAWIIIQNLRQLDVLQ